jgi:tetratricopeptide (TPR) repeat protein
MSSGFSARTIAGVFFVIFVTACSTPQTDALLRAPSPHLPAQAELTQTVFFPQEEHQCGPAALAMALAESGVSVQPSELRDLVYLPENQGSLQVEMLAAARRQGRLAYLLKPKMEDLLTELSAGNPVVVLQNLGLNWYPVWHYALAIGYNLPEREIVLRSGKEFRQTMALSTFEHTWERGRYWAMLVLPLGKLPQTADPESYLHALAAVERTSPQTDTLVGYAAALKRWPQHLATQIGAGNAEYRRHDLDRAEQILLKAVHDHPDSLAAFNNLAQVQADLGKFDAALTSARQAVQLGGPLTSTARKTLESIEQRAAQSQK